MQGARGYYVPLRPRVLSYILSLRRNQVQALVSKFTLYMSLVSGILSRFRPILVNELTIDPLVQAPLPPQGLGLYRTAMEEGLPWHFLLLVCLRMKSLLSWQRNIQMSLL